MIGMILACRWLISLEYKSCEWNLRRALHMFPFSHTLRLSAQGVCLPKHNTNNMHLSFRTLALMDEVLASVAETIKNFAVIYLVDITEVPDFNTMYELYDPSTVMFFFRNKHIMIDLGTGNNNKINWALKDKQEFIDIVETVYRGARKGRGLVIAPKDYSTKYRY
ncbi:thioredoxin-like protein YLS8 isoform X1 [Nicotiana tabacum]|uniref:Thioredoxin-like protein YLS8 isoform X1 n=2 Tax=Nicotiana TaxID=4085 RepID=A0A1S4B1S8_TOBAC|nr:PREDICTED: thioredoxin-like protein YLS8 isoform X1 [Nicotiana sylvestris]XP_016482882.1 PREDICTED: thioredoxin-like protein YLS8 isoform X1 [Nicotiana tabacum]